MHMHEICLKSVMGNKKLLFNMQRALRLALLELALLGLGNTRTCSYNQELSLFWHWMLQKEERIPLRKMRWNKNRSTSSNFSQASLSCHLLVSSEFRVWWTTGWLTQRVWHVLYFVLSQEKITVSLTKFVSSTYSLHNTFDTYLLSTNSSSLMKPDNNHKNWLKS